MINKRFKTYFQLNSKISNFSNAEIFKLLKKTEVSRGWGVNHIITLDGKKIFIKKIPLTTLELKNPFSTKNHFNLPTFYNYGVGSAGFGAFRELNTHIKTTNWVLNSEIENFPLMYHYRIIPKIEKNAPIDKVKHKAYVKYWGGNKNIDQYVTARKKAQYEIILFLEYIPFTARTWLLKNTPLYKVLTEDMKKVTTFLKKKGLIHFDMHLGNILTDGKKSFVTDFGLCLDKEFKLSSIEKKFFKSHVNYDYDELVCALSSPLSEALSQLPLKKKDYIQEKFALPVDISQTDFLKWSLEKGLELKNESLIKLDSSYLSFLKKNSKKILTMDLFYRSLRASEKKSVRYK